jgi:NDP-sugar pyrophosphorylase family protein
MRQVVVLAGGLGTRVAHLTGPAVPKALLPLDGRPFIDFKLAGLAADGATDVLMLTGHGAGALQEHVGDGARYGLRVEFVEDGPVLLGTAGAVAAASSRLAETFWLTYGDTLLDVPMPEVERCLDWPGRVAVMTVLENRDQWETSNVDVDEGLVTAYEKGGPPGIHHFIDYGMLLFRRAAFERVSTTTPTDLREVVRPLVDRGALGAFVVRERFHDVGTEAAWRETDAWCRETGLWARFERAIEARRAP